MALKSFQSDRLMPAPRPRSGRPHRDLWKGAPVKKLTEGLTKKGGRNNTGRITARRIGGGHKRRYRKIDFKRTKFDVHSGHGGAARVRPQSHRLHRPGHSTRTVSRAYILAPQRLRSGDR